EIPNAVTEARAAFFEARRRALIRARHPVAGWREIAEQGSRCREHLEHLHRVRLPVRREIQHATESQARRDQLDERGLDQPSLVVALLVPGIGKQHQYLVETCRRQLVAEHFDRVVCADAQVGQLAALRQHEQVTDTGTMHLDAEIVALGMRGGERGQVFAVAKADLQRARCPPAEQRIERQRRRRVVDAVTRPEILECARLADGHAAGAHDEAANRAMRFLVRRRLVHRAPPAALIVEKSAPKLREAASSAASQCVAESLSAPSVMYLAQANGMPSSRQTFASAYASMSTTSPSTACRCVAKESAVEHSDCGRCVKTGGNSMIAGSWSKGVTPGGKPRPLTSMSRWKNRLQATSVCAAIVRLPAVPRFTTRSGGVPAHRSSARRRARAAAALTLPTPVYSSCAPARSSRPRDSWGKAMTIKGFVICIGSG